MGQREGGRGRTGPAVLVLDDEPDMLQLVRLVLERRGLRVLTASDGRDALRLLRAEEVCVAIVDLLMPGMSGAQFLAEAARLDPDRRPAVLVVSALRPEAAERELGGPGEYTLLSKPFDLGELFGRVAAAVSAWELKRAGGGRDGVLPAC